MTILSGLFLIERDKKIFVRNESLFKLRFNARTIHGAIDIAPINIERKIKKKKKKKNSNSYQR